MSIVLAPETVTPTDLHQADDSELLVRTGEGDREAFEVLYARFARPVFGLALRRLGDRDRAEEAVQEAFASVWRSAHTFRPDRGTGSTWLYAVARNAITDRARARREPAAETPDEPSPEAGPPEQVEEGWVSWRVHRAVAELPDHERILLELAYWSGLSQTEIAEYLDLPLGTVKTRTRSALARLANVLDGELL